MSEFPIIIYILVFTSIGSIFSLAGGIILLSKERFARRISHLLTSFAAGSLLATAFLDLLPEASKEKGETDIFLWTLIGILAFFLLERLIDCFHHHSHTESERKQSVPLIVIGDSVHNFLDGITIAATFLVSVQLGIVTSLAVAAHEIPQEIGDFGILLHYGLPRKKVFWYNIMSSLTAIVGALLIYMLREKVVGLLPVFVCLTAGFFIYVAASDLIPEIHREHKRKLIFLETSLLLLGVLAIWLSVSFLE